MTQPNFTAEELKLLFVASSLFAINVIDNEELHTDNMYVFIKHLVEILNKHDAFSEEAHAYATELLNGTSEGRND